MLSKANSYAIEMVLKVPNSGTTAAVFGSTIASADRMGIAVQNSTIKAGQWNGSAYLPALSGTIDGASYVHILFQYRSAGTSDLFINKVSQSGALNPTIATTIGTKVGSTAGGTSPLTGTIAWMNIYNVGDLTSQEVTDSYSDLKTQLSARGVVLA
jgi:hypothetical protein